MLAYAVRRFFGALPTLLIIVTLAFFMMRLAPGGPFDTQRHLPPEIERNVAERDAIARGQHDAFPLHRLEPFLFDAQAVFTAVDGVKQKIAGSVG